MSESTDCSDSAVCQLTLAEEPPSGYLLQKVISTLMSHFNIMDTGTTSSESKEKIPPVMRDTESPQNWKSWNAVHPPTTQSYSQKVIQATMEVAKNILLFPESSIKEMISELKTTLSPKMLAVDWTLYLYLLEHDKGMLSKHQFSSSEDYEAWKKAELDLVKGLLNGATVDRDPKSFTCVTSGYSIAQLSLTRVKNIHRKALMAGIYSVIHFQDLYTVSPISNSLDQNPQLNHNLSFLLRDAGCSDGNPVIVISLWFKKAGFRSEGFLGYIKLTVQDLLDISDGNEKSFELQKRSNRSNVSGEIFLKMRRIQADQFIKSLYVEIMSCIPFCYEACLRDLLEVWYSKQIGPPGTVKDEYGCRAIIDTISIAWNAPYYTTAMISSDILLRLYTQKKIPLSLLKSDVLDHYISFLTSEHRKLPMHAKNAILKFLSDLYEYLQERLLYTLKTDIDENTSLEFAEIVETLHLMRNANSGSKKDVESIVKECVQGYMEHLRVIVFSEAGPIYGNIEKYIAKLKTFLSSCLFNLNDAVKGIIKIPEMVAELSATEVYEVLLKNKHNSGENVEETFKAYETAKEYIKVCKAANPSAVANVGLRDLFFEGVISWLDKTDKDMIAWVINAIKLDNFQIISPSTYHTTSVIDIFSCFSIHINFIKNLCWENKDDEQLFNERLYGTILKCLKLYTSQMVELLKNEIESPNANANMKTLKEVERSTDALAASYNNNNSAARPFTNGVGKSGANPDMKITSNVCAFLSNINAIAPKMESLLEANNLSAKSNEKRMQTQKIPDVSIPRTLSLRAQRQIKNSFIPVKIVVEKFESAIIKFPHLMPIKIRLSYNGNTVLTTKSLAQKYNAEYNEIAWINLSDGIDSEVTSFNPSKGMSVYSKLEISVVKCVYENGTIECNEEVASSAFFDIDWSSTEEEDAVISIPDCGKLTLKLIPVNYSSRTAVLPTMVKWLVESSINETHDIVAHKISSVYRAQIKTISHKFKSISKDYINKMFNSIDVLEKNKKSLSNSINSIIPQQHVDQEIVSKEIAPVLSFLNVNLERIVSEYPLNAAIKLVSRIWDCIMFANESLLVPLNIESRKEKSAWSYDRVKFLEITTQILYIFFECEGEGLSKEELNTLTYKSVCRIIKNYFEPRKILNSKKKSILDELNNKSSDFSVGQWPPAYWIFQILKVHGDNESVYTYIREIVDTFKQHQCDQIEATDGLKPHPEPKKVK